MAGLTGVACRTPTPCHPPPRTVKDGASFDLTLEISGGRRAPDAVHHTAAEECLSALPDSAIWTWTDGSEAAVYRGSSGALIQSPDGEKGKCGLWRAMCILCRSTRANAGNAGR